MRTLSRIITDLKTEQQADDFLLSLFTPDELLELNKRLQIVKLLKQGLSQREIAQILNVGVATVSRGSHELKIGKFKFLQNASHKKWWG